MSAFSRRLILLARYPIAGRVKTRLIPALGAEGAAASHRRLVLRAWRTIQKASRVIPADLEVQFDGANERAMSHWLGTNHSFVPQRPGNLGERMVSAFEEAFVSGSTATVIIGSDCPDLSAEVITEAFGLLAESPAVLGPAEDGGYYLIGLRRPIPELFYSIPWGTNRVLADSLAVLQQQRCKFALLKSLPDIDRPEDLPAWNRIADSEDCLEKISVIIPTLTKKTTSPQRCARPDKINFTTLLSLTAAAPIAPSTGRRKRERQSLLQSPVVRAR